jgi:hypothetical protein
MWRLQLGHRVAGMSFSPLCVGEANFENEPPWCVNGPDCSEAQERAKAGEVSTLEVLHRWWQYGGFVGDLISLSGTTRHYHETGRFPDSVARQRGLISCVSAAERLCDRRASASANRIGPIVLERS